MKLKKYITSTLILGLCFTSTANISFAAGKGNQSNQNTNSVIQQQLDAFEAIDNEINKNRSTAIKTDKDTNGLARAGTYPTRKGVILVTKDGKFGSLVGHAGIIYNSSTTVESFPKANAPKNTAGATVDGVSTYSNKWNSRYSTVYAVTTSGTSTTQDASAANYAYSQRNKPYNWVFTNTSTTSKFYCSQLVYRSYLNTTSKNLNQGGGIVFPIDLVQSANTYIIYTQGV